jgi:hypothetical protein
VTRVIDREVGNANTLFNAELSGSLQPYQAGALGLVLAEGVVADKCRALLSEIEKQVCVRVKGRLRWLWRGGLWPRRGQGRGMAAQSGTVSHPHAQIGDLDSLVGDFPPKERAELARRVERFRGDLATTRSDYERESMQASRSILLGAGGHPLSEEELRRRENAVATTDRLDSGTGKLVKSQALLHESVEMGIGTLDSLGDQERRLLNASGATNETNAYVNEASTVVRDIISRTWGNKICLWLVIIVLIVAIIAVVYFGYLT